MVIGFDVWQSRFGGDPAVVGRELRIGRDVHTIVGVMPPGFAFPVNHQYWVPLRIAPGTAVAPGMGPELDVFGRLAPGATREAAQAELGALGRRLAAEQPRRSRGWSRASSPYVDVVVGGEADGTSAGVALLRFLLALLLVVVALNVAVLVYARTVMRTGEIAVRTALGARRARIVAQLFAEALVLSALSAVAGLGIVAVGLNRLDEYLDQTSVGGAPFWMNPGLSAGTVLYALGLAVLSAVIVGASPRSGPPARSCAPRWGAWGATRRRGSGPRGRCSSSPRWRSRWRCLPAAIRQGGAMVRSAYSEPGFAAHEYVSTQFVVEQDADASTDARSDSVAADSARAITAALLARLQTEPGVVGATVSNLAPWTGAQGMLEADGPQRPPVLVRVLDVDTSYFGLFDVPVLAGRNFAARTPRSTRGTDR
jgi:hypothetical protein